MRIFHTSDWHLGRMFAGEELREDQERFCDWLVEAAIGEQVDLVIVAGDIYDRAVAPAGPSGCSARPSAGSATGERRSPPSPATTTAETGSPLMQT